MNQSEPALNAFILFDKAIISDKQLSKLGIVIKIF